MLENLRLQFDQTGLQYSKVWIKPPLHLLTYEEFTNYKQRKNQPDGFHGNYIHVLCLCVINFWEHKIVHQHFFSECCYVTESTILIAFPLNWVFFFYNGKAENHTNSGNWAYVYLIKIELL